MCISVLSNFLLSYQGLPGSTLSLVSIFIFIVILLLWECMQSQKN